MTVFGKTYLKFSHGRKTNFFKDILISFIIID